MNRLQSLSKEIHAHPRPSSPPPRRTWLGRIVARLRTGRSAPVSSRETDSPPTLRD